MKRDTYIMHSSSLGVDLRGSNKAPKPPRRPRPADVLAALSLVRTGELVSLARVRFPGMPIYPGHPPFQVTSFRTPQGLRTAEENLWPTANEVGLGCMTEVISSTAHSGAHVDALAHMTIGDDDHWHGGANAREHLGDFGPTVGDAAELEPFFARAVLLDVPRHRGVDVLPAGSPITADEIRTMLDDYGLEIRPGDIVLFRTGYMSLWPDAVEMAKHKSAGPDLTAAHLLADLQVLAAGSDTEAFEVQPTNHPGSPANPQPVHTRLLIEEGIYLFESLDLEAISAIGRHEFPFIALPLKIRGATGSMVDPVAVL
jgi:kynurenine formamidase